MNSGSPRNNRAMNPLEKAQVANKPEVLTQWAAKYLELNANIIESHGLGLAAKTRVETDVVLVRVPSALAFTVETVAKLATKSDELTRWLEILPQKGMHYLHRAILYLILFDPQVWLPYFKLLPDTNAMDLPFAWSLEEIETLRGTSIYGAALSKRLYVQKMYTDFFGTEEARAIVEAHGREDVSFQIWLVVYEWLASRCLTDPTTNSPALVPIIDLCNHSVKPNARYEVIDGDFLLVHDRSMHSGIDAGEEIVIDYGSRSNAELLFNYGFVPSTPTQHLIQLYDPEDEEIRRLLDPSRNLEVPAEDREDLEASYMVVLRFLGNPMQRLELSTEKWSDQLISLLATEDDAELKMVDNEYGLYFGDIELTPENVETVVRKNQQVVHRAEQLLSDLCIELKSRADSVASRRTKDVVQLLAGQESLLYETFI